MREGHLWPTNNARTFRNMGEEKKPSNGPITNPFKSSFFFFYCICFLMISSFINPNETN
jgi:hypothetical protein